MITSPWWILVTLIAFFIAAITAPTRARCDRQLGFHADGARRDGVVECARPFGCRDSRGPRGGWTSTCQGEDRYASEIYCTGIAQPILDTDGVTVGCQPGGWR
jgi:hypothetical protein